MTPIQIWQGADQVIVVTTSADLSAATEIEFRIDTSPQITKTLTAGGISAVTTTEFRVQIDAADTESIPPGKYLMQTRYTDTGSKIHQGRFWPNKVKILESAFVTNRNVQYGNDYNA